MEILQLEEIEIKYLEDYFLKQNLVKELVLWTRRTKDVATRGENQLRAILKGRYLINEDTEPIVRKAFEMAGKRAEEKQVVLDEFNTKRKNIWMS